MLGMPPFLDEEDVEVKELLEKAKNGFETCLDLYTSNVNTGVSFWLVSLRSKVEELVGKRDTLDELDMAVVEIGLHLLQERFANCKTQRGDIVLEHLFSPLLLRISLSSSVVGQAVVVRNQSSNQMEDASHLRRTVDMLLYFNSYEDLQHLSIIPTPTGQPSVDFAFA